MNEFSILCRVLGSLYYRQPQDPLLVPLFTLIRDGKLAASWPLEQDELLVSPYRSAWVEGATEAEVRGFLTQHGIPTGDGPTDHIGSLLLAASWLEDHASDDESETLETLFADYLLPWCGTFLGKVEAHAQTAFWRTMALLTREAISAMWDELQEENDE